MNLEEYLASQQVFSERTFGPGERTKGVLDHIAKELDEIKAKPDDLSEWVDVLTLAFDGALRKGFTPGEIASCLTAKLYKNIKRKWPDYRNYSQHEAIEHIKDSDKDMMLIQRGTIIRYNKRGPTAIMRVDSCSNQMYYGRHCLGGSYSCSKIEAIIATQEEVELFRSKLS